jgi:hypothetical protein
LPYKTKGKTGIDTIFNIDILKAHGEETKVKPLSAVAAVHTGKQGEARSPARLSHSGGNGAVGWGSEFIIQLPLT